MNGHSCENNFQKFKEYGNHKSVEVNINTYKSLMVKYNRRGNIYVADPELLEFINHLHLTPKELVDVDNK